MQITAVGGRVVAEGEDAVLLRREVRVAGMLPRLGLLKRDPGLAQHSPDRSGSGRSEIDDPCETLRSGVPGSGGAATRSRSHWSRLRLLRGGKGCRGPPRSAAGPRSAATASAEDA